MKERDQIIEEIIIVIKNDQRFLAEARLIKDESFRKPQSSRVGCPTRKWWIKLDFLLDKVWKEMKNDCNEDNLPSGRPQCINRQVLDAIDFNIVGSIRVNQSSAINNFSGYLTAEAVCPFCQKNNTLLHVDGPMSMLKKVNMLVCKHLKYYGREDQNSELYFEFAQSE
jgi:hypothetical protein